MASALNIASHGVTHPFLCQAINAYIVTEDPQIPKASSILRPVRVTAPPGSVVNSLFPAPVGVRYATVLRVLDAVLGALAQALPGRIPAAPAGGISPVVVSVLDPLTGRRHVQVVEPMLGGGGGRPTMDGLDAADSTAGYLRNTPVESIEAEVPIVVRRYHLIPDTGGAGARADGVHGCDPTQGFLRNTPVESIEADVPIVMRRYDLIPDSGGPGRHRGGMGIRMDFQVFHPDAIVTARGMERFRLEPWGVAGGRAGTMGSCVVNRDTPRACDIGKIDVLRLEPGDLVSIVSPSGGGHGDPRRRDPERVRADVRAGFQSVEQARERYGVALVDGAVDAEATARLRAAMPAPPDGPFDYGRRRAELERRWPPALQDAAVRLLESVPPAVRDWGKHQIYDRIQAIAA